MEEVTSLMQNEIKLLGMCDAAIKIGEKHERNMRRLLIAVEDALDALKQGRPSKAQETLEKVVEIVK